MQKSGLIPYCIFFLLTLSNCAPPTQRLKADSRQVIAYSYEQLLQQGLESDSTYDAAGYLSIQFPNGKNGAFVVLGFRQPPRGYQFLYRFEDEGLQLLLLKQTPGITWGVESLRENQVVQMMNIIEPFTISETKQRQTIKVTGASFTNGLWQDGYFEVIEITNNEPLVLFTGAKFATDNAQFDIQYQYEYLDSDSDGNLDLILATSERCEYQIDQSTNTRQEFECLNAQAIYQFDGTKFVEKFPE